jgi:hypothetical protein
MDFKDGKDGTMNRTRRMIGIGALVMLVALGTGLVLENAYSSAHSKPATVSEPATARDAATAPFSPLDVQPASYDQEYDRSDLLLSQG